MIQELCCPANTTCQRAVHTESHVICCPDGFRCSHSTMIAICPFQTFACPLSLHGGCCPVGMKCAHSQCLEYEYKTLAVFRSIPAIVQQCPLTAVIVQETVLPPNSSPSQPSAAAYALSSTGSSPSHATSPACMLADHLHNLDTPVKSVTDLPIGERTWGKPTAWSAKIGEIAISRGAERLFDRFVWLPGQLTAFAAIMVAS